VPGGGSAAALVGALGAALVAMVGRKLANSTATEELVARADELREKLSEARLGDEEAYGGYVTAQKLPKGTDEEREIRRRALQAALNDAAEAPLHAASLAVDVLKLAEQLARGPMRALASDVGSAAEFAHAAITACGYNVRINHRYMDEGEAMREQAARLARLEGAALAIVGRVRDAVAKG